MIYIPRKDIEAVRLRELATKADSGWMRKWKERNLPNIERGLWKITKALEYELPTWWGSLYIRVFRNDGDILDFGLVSLRVVTNNGVAYIVDAFQNLVELESMKYHAIGTGNTAESAAQSALANELTTQYNPDNTRATGTTTEVAANTYRTVGTNEVDASVGIVEHGLFNQAATGGGVMFDRSVFNVINLSSGNRIESTYDWTATAGG